MRKRKAKQRVYFVCMVYEIPGIWSCVEPERFRMEESTDRSKSIYNGDQMVLSNQSDRFDCDAFNVEVLGMDDGFQQHAALRGVSQGKERRWLVVSDGVRIRMPQRPERSDRPILVSTYINKMVGCVTKRSKEMQHAKYASNYHR